VRVLWFNLATDTADPILGFTTTWIRAVANKVEHVDVITMRAGAVDVPGNVRVWSIGKEKGYSEARRAAEFYRYLFHSLRDGVDACFSHMTPLFSIMAAPALKAHGVPLVTWYAHLHLNPKLKLAHRLSTRMVTSLATAYPYRKDKLVVIGQGIDTDLFSPDAHRAVESPVPMILCVGRMSPVKDHPTLLKAAALLRKLKGSPFRLVIVGGPATESDSAYLNRLQEEIDRLGLRPVTEFVPPVPMPELVNWYRQCAVHVSLTPIGSGDKAALEAMSCGRPCVMANAGFRETLGEHGEALLFKAHDARDLAARLEWVLSLPDSTRSIIGLSLRDQVVQRHSLTALGDKLLSVLDTHRSLHH
jgi:glycosyltransferase involved in cell wall biosynthesis